MLTSSNGDIYTSSNTPIVSWLCIQPEMAGWSTRVTGVFDKIELGPLEAVQHR